MKKLIEAIFWFLILLMPVIALAETYSSIDIQEGLISGDGSRLSQTTDVSIELTAFVPDYPQFDPITFKSDAEVRYNVSGSNVTIMGNTLPPLKGEIKGIPDSFGPVTLVINIKERVLMAGLSDDGSVDVAPFTLIVDIYNLSKGEINERSEVLATVELKKIHLDVEALDIEDRVVSATFKTKVPRCDNEMLNSILAGVKLRGDFFIEY